MPRPSRTLSTVEERRAHVLVAAAPLFGRRGYHGTSTSEVAHQAGISQAYLYRLFPDKLSLFLAVVSGSAERLERALRQVGTTTSPPAEAGGSLPWGPEDVDFAVLLQAVCAGEEPGVRQAVRDACGRLASAVGGASGSDAAGTLAQMLGTHLLAAVRRE